MNEHPMRVFIASLATETNTFAPFPTGISGFEEYGIVRDAARAQGLWSGPMRAFRTLSQAAGYAVVESLSASAQPSGRTVRAVYQRLRDDILADLRAAGPIDIVLLMLHGAMVADGYDDCEGDLVTRMRRIVPRAIIGVELDPHCHMTATMAREADLIVTGKQYPHVDFDQRAQDLFELCVRAAKGEIRPVAALIDTRMIGFYPTLEVPMSDIVAELEAVERQPGILSASIAHGFPWADVADVGTRVLVYADADGHSAAREASALARRLYALRETLKPNFPDIRASLDRALGLGGRVVLGDFSDNPGGGAPCDSTFFLKAMLERQLGDAVIGAIWDPLVAQVCAEAGAGARLSVRLGGKCGPSSGDPLDLEVEVMGVVEDHTEDAFGSRQPMGRSVWLRCQQIDIAVCSVRTQVFSPDAFTGLGIELSNKRLIVVKSSNHYQASFRAVADHLWHVNSPGALSLDFAALAYTQRDGNFYPRVDDPWAQCGEPEPAIYCRVAA
ncbi:MAG: M81 family metallopeptidase [Luteimonas sp.]